MRNENRRVEVLVRDDINYRAECATNKYVSYFLPPAKRANVPNVTACTTRSGEKRTAMTRPRLRPSEEPELDFAAASFFGASAFGAASFLEPKDGALKDGKDGALNDGIDGALADGAANDLAGLAGLVLSLACCAAKRSPARSFELPATWVTSTAAFAIGVAAIVIASTAAHACSLAFARTTVFDRRASAARGATVVVCTEETRAIMMARVGEVLNYASSVVKGVFVVVRMKRTYG